MYTGAKIIRDGLVLHFDPANVKCFRGEPTVNIFPRSADSLIFIGACNGTNYGFGSSTNMQQVIDNTQRFDNRASITKVSRINSGVYQADYILFGLSSPSNSTRVLSFWYYGTYGTLIQPYNNDGYESIYYLDDNNVWQGGNQFQDVPVKIKEWQKITLKIVNNGTGGFGLSWMILHSNQWGATLDSTEYWLFTLCQYEDKDHSTPYTPTSRGTTVATGGGLIDLSNNQNHGELINGVLYDSDNCGSLKFDGVDDYVGSNNINVGNVFTFNCWVKPTTKTRQTIFCNGYPYSLNKGFLIECPGNSANGSFISLGADNKGAETHIGLTSNIWQMLTCRVNGSSELIKLYVNGSEVNSYILQTDANIQLEYDYDKLRIGNRYGSDLSNSNISQVLLYNRALSQSEITQIYNSTKSRYL